MARDTDDGKNSASGHPTDAGQEAGTKRTAAARVLALLGAFSRGGGSLTLSEISRYADLSLTTTHRLAKEVLEWGGLELDEKGRYRLSRKILDLASASTEALRLRETALPHLIDLHHRTGLTVTLSVRDGMEVVYLEALRSHPNYTGANRIGGRLPMHITATGLVLLAYADHSVLEDYLKTPLKPYTPHTVTEPSELVARLRTVRKDGYALAVKSMTMRAGSVAAPVIGADGTAETAVGVIYLVDQHAPGQLIEQVRFTANRISRHLRQKDPAPDPRTIDFNRRQAGLI